MPGLLQLHPHADRLIFRFHPQTRAGPLQPGLPGGQLEFGQRGSVVCIDTPENFGQEVFPLAAVGIIQPDLEVVDPALFGAFI